MIEDCKIIDLPVYKDHRGNLTFIESTRHIPFDLKRVYYLYEVPSDASRAAHGHKNLQQLMIAIAGSFDVVLDDGKNKKTFHLNQGYHGLYISPMIWRNLYNFSAGSVCMVLASDFYDEADYYQSYDAFLEDAKKNS